MSIKPSNCDKMVLFLVSKASKLMLETHFLMLFHVLGDILAFAKKRSYEENRMFFGGFQAIKMQNWGNQ
ncbi:MAG: hypothetical protein IJQ44_07170 [Bacteroidaceae bacterium]|nr:hypothetical protein [Bacteroidaceae bacterium]